MIVIEQAKPYNIDVDFVSHAMVGVPVTVASVLVALLWALVIR